MNHGSEQPPAGQTGRQSIGQAIVDWLIPVAMFVDIIGKVTSFWQSWK
ncbi:hypothetical protein [Streptomyces vinaceus]